MSPILVRPVREQLEHDRVIRLLQAKYKRKFEVGINPGNVQSAPIGAGPSAWYPDLVLYSTERKGKVQGIVEVETVESINHLEAMSQWGAFSRLKIPFALYVPATMVDVARRFCADLQIAVTEIWAYSAVGEQIRFTPILRTPGLDDVPVSKGAKPAAKPAVTKAPVPKTSVGKATLTRAAAPTAVAGRAAGPGKVGLASRKAVKPPMKSAASKPAQKPTQKAPSKPVARAVAKKSVAKPPSKRR